MRTAYRTNSNNDGRLVTEEVGAQYGTAGSPERGGRRRVVPARGSHLPSAREITRPNQNSHMAAGRSTRPGLHSHRKVRLGRAETRNEL